MKMLLKILALIFFGVSAAHGESKYQRRGYDQRFMQELNLTSEQADKVKSIRQMQKLMGS